MRTPIVHVKLNTGQAKGLPRRQLLAAALALGAGPTRAITPPCPALLQHTVNRLQDEKPQSLCQYAGQVLLVVNTASFCGFTPQYAGLEALQRRYAGQGLVVLGFPSNDFGRQEPGSNQAIAAFCENSFGVRFPMFTKITVTGREAHPLYRQLAVRTGQMRQWNFHKYLVARDGQTVRSFDSSVEPENPQLVRDIERFLSTRP